jgi:oligoribonuclease NrnB/cAMP/cGMP phosphodiesterase (DHH superfamily)
MSKPLVIYHANCADGFTAAWAIWTKHRDWEFYPGVYSQPPPDCLNREVYMVDFSYKRPVIEQMLEDCASMTILDHHKSAIEDLQPLLGHAKLAADFDLERSGARIAWDEFHPGEEPPALLLRVEDRDLWRFNYYDTREVQACVFSYEYTFEMWERMMYHSDLSDMAVEGRAIERKHFKDIHELLGVYTRRMVIDGHDVPVANLPYTMSSDAGTMLAEGEPFAACYSDGPDGRIFSLRSTKHGVDVSEVAKQYGGGGHRNASGFKVPRDHELARA